MKGTSNHRLGPAAWLGTLLFLAGAVGVTVGTLVYALGFVFSRGLRNQPETGWGDCTLLWLAGSGGLLISSTLLLRVAQRGERLLRMGWKLLGIIALSALFGIAAMIAAAVACAS